MSAIITDSGSEPVIGEAIAYLERRYGLPRQDIQAVNVYARVGDPTTITVTVFMEHEEDLVQRDVDFHAPPVAADLGEAPPDRPEDARYEPWPAQ